MHPHLAKLIVSLVYQKVSSWVTLQQCVALRCKCPVLVLGQRVIDTVFRPALIKPSPVLKKPRKLLFEGAL